MGHEFSSLLCITDNGLKKWILVGNLGNMVLEIMWQPCLINYLLWIYVFERTGSVLL